MKKILAVVAVLTCLGVSNASASSIDFLGEGKKTIVSIHSPVLGDLTVYAGELDWQWIGAPPPGYAAGSFYTYCIDANNWVTDPETVTALSTDGLNNPGVTDAGKKAAWLFNTYAGTIHSSGTDIQAGALQVAIWAALYNPTDSLTSGPFKLYTTGDVATQAQTYLDALYTGPGGYNTSTATWLDAATGFGQDQIINNLPEPASLLLFGSGLAALAARSRRRRTSAA